MFPVEAHQRDAHQLSPLSSFFTRLFIIWTTGYGPVVITCRILPLNWFDIWLILFPPFSREGSNHLLLMSFLPVLTGGFNFFTRFRNGGHHVGVLQRHIDRVLHHLGGLVRWSIRRSVLSHVCHKTSLVKVSGSEVLHAVCFRFVTFLSPSWGLPFVF